jgi:hypothetical protein
MKQRDDSVQYTARGIPREIDRALRQNAARRKQSLNRVILDELAAATGHGVRHTDFRIS